MDKNILSFAVFIINQMANKYSISTAKIYQKLQEAECLDKYIIPHYEVLHTLGTEYLIQDIETYLKNRGVFIK